MKTFAWLAIMLPLFTQAESARRGRKRSDDVSQIDEHIRREDYEVPLMARIVPMVVNPPETLIPPAFAAAIYEKEVLMGSGAILNKHFLLTLCTVINAADNAASIKIAYPVFNDTNIESLVKFVSVTNVKTHPECGDKSANPAKNIGLIHTKEPMEHVKYPKLPSTHIPEDKSKFIISNFRVLNHAATYISTAIWYIITKKVDNLICSLLFQADGAQFSEEGNLCMAYFHLGDAKDCRGDFGAPLSIRYNDEDTLVGLILHKHDCGHPREAASFVCVKTNKNWIESNIKS